MRGLGFLCQAPAAGELRILKSTWTGLRDPTGSPYHVYLFVDGDVDDDDDDVWLPVVITGVTASTCGAEAAFRLATAAVLPAVKVHTPVRLYEVMELKLHSADGEWWLGARSLTAGGAVQPILGPLTANGFQLEYLNSLGVATADETAIKSIRLTVRGLTEDAVRQGGFGAMGNPEEVLVTQVLLRNSIRP
jgi:hypothetical protein